MIINLVNGVPAVGVFTDDDDGLVMFKGLNGRSPEDWYIVPYRKLLESGAVGFPKGREWDETPEDALRLYESGKAQLEAEIKADIESGKTGEPDEVEGYLL